MSTSVCYLIQVHGTRPRTRTGIGGDLHTGSERAYGCIRVDLGDSVSERSVTGTPMKDVVIQTGGAHAAGRLIAIVRDLLAQSRPEVASRLKMTLESSLERDLGMDSLARAELMVRIEREFGVRLPDDVLAEAETLRHLLNAILEAAAELRPAPAPEAALLTGADVEPLPDGTTTLVEALTWRAARHSHRVHVTFLASDEEVQTFCYGEFLERARGVAAGLQAAGLERQQAVALMLPTSLDFFPAYCGILIAGGIPVPIYPPMRMSQIEEHLKRQAGILANCLAPLLVTVPEAKLLARLLRGDAPTLKRIVTVAELEAADGEPRPVPLGPKDIALLQYTSGSTGDPKGVILTHENLLANLRVMFHATGADSNDIFVSWLPLYHDMGLIGAWLASLAFAIHLVLMSPTAFLSRPARWLWAIHRFRGTISAAPNFAYEICATKLGTADLEGLDLSSWRWAFNGAEPVSAETLARFADRFAAYGFDPRSLAPVYGLAECSLDLAFPPSRRGALIDLIDREALTHTGRAYPVAPQDRQALKIVACGRALPGYSIRIVDAKGRELPERTEGRVEFQGPSATSGYYRNPQATAKLFEGEWLDSGDLGYLAEGELFLTGRTKDMVIRGGHNLYPYELEEAVGGIPGIRKGCVAVFGVRDQAGATDRVVVLAETRETDPGKREALRAAINNIAVDLLGGPADEIVLAPPHSVLKTSSGKIRRGATREVYERGLVGASRHAVWMQLLRLTWRNASARLKRPLASAGRLLYGPYVWSLFTLVAVAGLAASFLRDLKTRRAAGRGLARFLLRAAGIPVTVEGLECLPRDRPFTLVANHASYIDSIIVVSAIPRDFAFTAKAELEGQWLIRHVLESVGTRFVERFDVKQGVSDTRELAALAGTGQSLAFFPEGTFRRAPGLLSWVGVTLAVALHLPARARPSPLSHGRFRRERRGGNARRARHACRNARGAARSELDTAAFPGASGNRRIDRARGTGLGGGSEAS
jgi:acyl carrier protein